jgi:hypothetical protein
VFYRFGADLVLLVHLLFIGFAIVGGIAVLRWHWLALVHLPAALWATVVELMGWVCPLTPLEVYLRVAAGDAGYSGGFIQHYLLPIVYPAGLTREIQWLLAALVVLVNAAIYVVLLVRVKRRRATR